MDQVITWIRGFSLFWLQIPPSSRGLLPREPGEEGVADEDRLSPPLADGSSPMEWRETFQGKPAHKAYALGQRHVLKDWAMVSFQ